MRILFAADVAADPNTGAAGTEWQTIQALRALGHDVDEIWASDMRRRIAHGNLHYLLELPREYDRAIAARRRKREYDVIHVNQSHCLEAARRHRREKRAGVFVMRSHGLDDHMETVLKRWRPALGVRGGGAVRRVLSEVVGGLLRRRDRQAYAAVDGIIISSSVDRDYLVEERGVEESRVALIPQAAPPAFLSTPAPSADAARMKRLLHVGGFAYWKGVHAVAGALNRLAEADAGWTMTWVCREQEQSQVRELLTAQAARNVTMLSWLTQDELRDVYDAHGIFLAPSLFDGFGKVFLEAMARGLVVIGTRTGGMIDLIEDGSNGFLVPFNDADGIAWKVQTLWGGPAVAGQISSAAAATARAFTWQRVARETIAFYERLLTMHETNG